MFCPSCGKDCGDAKFCSECGQNLRNVAIGNNTESPRLKDDEKANRKYAEAEYPEPPVGRYNNHDHDYIEIKKDSLIIYKKNFLQKPTSHEILYKKIRCVTYGDLGVLGGFLSIRDNNNQSPPLITDKYAYADETSIPFSRYQSDDFQKVYDFLKICADMNSPDGQQESQYARNLAEVARTVKYSVNPQKAERDEKITELEKTGQVYCPKCLSTSISANRKGFGFVRGAVGSAIGLDVGMIAGGIGSKKIICTCLKCGHQWKPGKK